MADLLSHESNNLLNGFRFRTEENKEDSAFIKPLNIENPTSIDWREFGAVSSVKSQGNCASSHAFSAVNLKFCQKFN